MRIADLNWMQLEAYLERDDRIVLPLGCTEQHAYLSLATDSILAERVATEAAEPLNVPVLPALAYGLTPYFAAFPGSPSVTEPTYLAFISEILDSLRGQGFGRFLLVNGHGGNAPVHTLASDSVVVHDWWRAPKRSARRSARDRSAASGSAPTRRSYAYGRPAWRRPAKRSSVSKTPADRPETGAGGPSAARRCPSPLSR